MEPIAFPVEGVFPGIEHNRGTAFLALIESELFIATAAHVAQGRVPTVEWDQWPSRLTINLTEGDQTVELFDSESSPLFRYFHTQGSPTMADAILIPLAQESELAGLLSGRFGVHEVSATLSLPEASSITVHGYPADGHSWPALYRALPGKAIEVVHQAMLVVDVEYAPGVSGGPCLTDDGMLVGLFSGHHPDPSDPGRIVMVNFLAFLATESP